MIVSFLEGFLLGLGAAAPLGPINILIMNRALVHYPHAVVTGLGAMSADAVYLALILFGVVSFLHEGLILDTFGVLGAGFLLFLAYRIFKDRNRSMGSSNMNSEKKRLLPAYIQGVTLTFLNPYTVAFWLSVTGYVSSKALNPVLILLGMFTAIGMWVTLVPYLVHRSRHRISTKVSYSLSLFSAVLLAGFGVSLLVEVLF